MTRFNGIVATRMDMDQSQFPEDVSPVDDNGDPLPGIYDTLIPILQQLEARSTISSDPITSTSATIRPAPPIVRSNRLGEEPPYYHAIEAMGGEIGTHSYTHLISPPTTTFTAHTVGTTPAGAIQVTLDQLPSFYGVTVGMVVSGLNIGANTPLPRVGGESGAVVNTTVTAVSGNTVTLSYVPGGYGTLNNGVLGDIPAGTDSDLHGPGREYQLPGDRDRHGLSSSGHPFTYEYEFNQAKLLLEQQLGHPIYGAAVPGAAETYATAQNILPLFPVRRRTIPGYTGYVTGGWTGIGAGYPGAIGFMSPYQPGFRLYRAEHDLRLHRGPIPGQDRRAGRGRLAGAVQRTRGQCCRHAHRRVAHPRLRRRGVEHDHRFDHAARPTRRRCTPTSSQQAYNAGYEFVTLEDLASRIESFAQSGVTSTVNGNVINVSVASAHAGDFALDVAGQGTQVIQNVANWYAYDSDSLFLPETGGNYHDHPRRRRGRCHAHHRPADARRPALGHRRRSQPQLLHVRRRSRPHRPRGAREQDARRHRGHDLQPRGRSAGSHADRAGPT